MVASTRENGIPHFLHTRGTVYCWETGVHTSATKKMHWVVAKISPDGFRSIPDLVQIWSRFGPDLVQIEVHPGPDQKIWTACPDMLSRFWTKSRPVQTTLFSHDPCFFAEAAPLFVSSQPPPPSQIMPRGRARGVVSGMTREAAM
jgi:hypothetical protein